MSATPKPEDLMWEHKAIRKQIKFLTNSLSGLSTQSSQGGVQSNQLNDQITLYRWSLYDFREAIRRHIDLDERIFKIPPGSTPGVGLRGEHETIREQLDKAISLAENAVYNKLSNEELNKSASDIVEVVDRVCESIVAHIAKEDRLLKKMQKES